MPRPAAALGNGEGETLRYGHVSPKATRITFGTLQPIDSVPPTLTVQRP